MHIVLCSHLLRDVEETCEEVLILKQGRIVHYSNLEEERRANKRFVELETVGDEKDFADALTALGCECVGRAWAGSRWFCLPSSRCAKFTAWLPSATCNCAASTIAATRSKTFS